MGADSAEEEAQDRCECQRDERDGDDGDCGPEEEGVPLPEPELTGECERVFAGGVEELVRLRGAWARCGRCGWRRG